MPEKNTRVIYQSSPVKNHFLYVWHITVKISSFVLFGAGTVAISIVVFPVMLMIFWGRRRFKRAARRFISAMFRFFTWYMSFLHGSRFKTSDDAAFKNLGGCIVAANHPSLLDVVVLISRIPHADCIVNASLSGKNIVHVITRALYISNNLPYPELIEKCRKSLSEGNTLIIFPEGTRSLPSGQNPFKKGAARVALATGCPIVPVFMGGNDKVGLRKHDPMLKFHPSDMYRYNLYIKEPLTTDEYRDLPEPVAARRITKKLQKILSYENNFENMIGAVEVPVEQITEDGRLDF